MKKLTLISIAFLCSIAIFSQSNKWDLNGNSSGTNDFIGTTNNEALVFKTDNTVRMKISPTGNVIIKDLESTGFGLVKANDNGKIGKIDYPNNPSHFFDGNGNFTPLSTIIGWSMNANLVTLDGSKKVGIGVSNPSLQFEVLGDSKIDGNLRVVDTLKVGDSTIIMVGNNIYTDNAAMAINGSAAYNFNTLINPKNSTSRVSVGTFNPAAKFNIRDGNDNNLSVGADFLNGSVGVMIKSHKNNTVLPISMASAIAANLSFSANEFNFYSDGHTTPDVKIKQDGKVGIGTSFPLGKLTIKDGADNNLTLTQNIGFGNGMILKCHNDLNSTFGEIAFDASQFVFQNGPVKIGNNIATVPGAYAAEKYALYVEYGILTERVKVALHTTGDWSDYVFSDDYQLLSLDSLESYINQNNHLPGIPSSEEMVKNGNDLATTDKLLLEKVENLFLYIIQLNGEIELLKEQNKLLMQKNDE